MPFTCSIVLSTQNSGAICTSPPIDTVIRMATSRTIEFFSKVSCFTAVALSYSAGWRRSSGAAAMRGWLLSPSRTSPRIVRQML